MSAQQRRRRSEQKVGRVGGENGGGEGSVGRGGAVCLQVCVKRRGVTFPGGADERCRLRGCPFPTCVPNLSDDHHRLRARCAAAAAAAAVKAINVPEGGAAHR